MNSTNIPEPLTGELYLVGRIPIGWLRAAGGLPRKALQVGLEIWLAARLKGSGTVPISVSAVARNVGFNRTTGHRAIQALHDAGLITRIEVGDGRNTLVQLHWPAVVRTA